VPKNLAAVPAKQTAPMTASAALQERKQQLVRTAIWDAATDLFVEKGYDETTIDDIALKSGVSRRSFFRYFSSKSDLMAHGVVGYGTYLTEAIAACPPEYSVAEIFRQTVFQVARQCAAQPRTRKIMQIAAKYPEAREAQHARTADLQRQVEAAFVLRYGQRSKNEVTPGILAGLIVSVLGVTFRSWFEQGQQDISAAAEQVLATLGRLVCQNKKLSETKGQVRR
jgi:AcrR family transcriptional regulator